jgi:hypothetical protein
MKRIIIIIVIAATLWAANWYRGFNQNLDLTTGWFKNAATFGQNVEQHGFPNRYDVTLPDVGIDSLDAYLDFIQIMRVVYNPKHRIIAIPQEITLFGRKITADQIRASIVSDGAPERPRITFEAIKPEFPNGVIAERAQISIIPAAHETEMTVFVDLVDVSFSSGNERDNIRIILYLTGTMAFDWSTLIATRNTLNMQITGTGSITSKIFGSSDISIFGTLRTPQISLPPNGIFPKDILDRLQWD